ncbi:MAG: hypothetical protein H6656_16040 [Ardenticatenaceae bacterium]|nr:hypothetical protein [Ardenticatenaceae bacterium]
MNNNNPITVYTPVSLMAVFADAFKIDPKHSVLWLRGIYQDRKRKSYRGYYFDRLKDELGGQIITLKLPKQLKQNLQDGGYYLFKGTLDKDVRWDGVIEPVFIVSEMADQKSSHLTASLAKRATLQQEKANMGYRDLDGALKQKLDQNQKPHIALLCGKTSIVLQDVFSALKEARSRYRFTEQRVNLLDKWAIINALAQGDKEYDVIAIVRGGGPGLEIFDDVAIAEASLLLKPILVTAIGHAQDDTLLQKLADKQFITPTALGNYLRETAVPTPTSALNTSTSKETHLRLAPATWIILAIIILLLGFLLGQFLA